MDVLGSVKNRLKTMAIIRRNRKMKLKKQKKPISIKTDTLIKRDNEITINLKKVKMSEIQPQRQKPPYSLNRVKPNFNRVKIEKPKVKVSNAIAGKKRELKSEELKSELGKEVKAVNKQQVLSEKSKKLADTDIIRRFKIYIANSKKEIKSLKKEVEKEKEALKKAKTEQELEIHHEKIEILKIKISNLKRIYENILNQYEFAGFEEINDFLLDHYIDNFKFKSNINEVDLLVLKCKNEITYLEVINELISKYNALNVKENKIKGEVRYFSRDYDNRAIDYDKLLNKEVTIDNYLKKVENYLPLLEKEIENNTLVSSKSTRLKFDREYINNLCRLGVGLSLFDKTVVGAFIGAFLIKKSISPLLIRAFKKEEITKYSFKYQEYIKKINDNLDMVHDTCLILKDSLADISFLKSYMEQEYKDYLQVKTYQDLYKKIVSLESNLKKKYEKSEDLEKKLLDQKQKNKEKQKKLSSL